jgi:hypothetical protein
MQQEEYLARLVIEQWRLQAASNDSITDIYFYQFGQEQAPVGLMIATAFSKNEQERQMADAIAKATKMPYYGGYYKSLLCSDISDSVKVTVLLGKLAKVDFPGHLIQTHSLHDLQMNKKLKGDTWRDLQIAMRIMTE